MPCCNELALIFALTQHSESGSAYVDPARSARMSSSSPARTQQPRRSSHPHQARKTLSPRGEAIAFVLRSIPMIVAAVSVIAASNYLAYMIGRKQVSYEELRKQVDRIVELVDQKRVEEEVALSTPKPQQEKLEQNRSAFTDLTTSTINGKTMVAPESASAGRPIAASLMEDSAVASPAREPPPVPALNAAKHREIHSAVRQRTARRQKPSPTAAAPWRDPADPTHQLTTVTPAARDNSLAGQ
jgi:hypothetical protein